MYNFNPYSPPMQTQVIRVNGENGARALNLAPNSSALVLDVTAPLIWLCSTDGAGYKTCTPYSIAEYKPEPEPSTNDLITRIERLEAIINESDPKRTERSAGAKSGNGSGAANVQGLSNRSESDGVPA